MPPELARQLLDSGCRLLNLYGPTETTIWSTAARITGDPGERVPAGTPIANTAVFVAGPDGAERPPGLWGEVCVAGAGVAAGYRNRPDLTEERFRAHPRYGRYYRTGDVGRLRFDGALEISGRLDRQIKLRGHRLELGEVEAALRGHPSVRAAAVVAHGDLSADGALHAFVEPAGTPPAAEELWRHARDTLPAHAVPAGFTVVATLPTTTSGKIDYPALTTLAARTPARRVEPPDAVPGGSGLTGVLVELWRESLAEPALAPDANFFLNGGNSLDAAGLVARIRSATGFPVPLRAVIDAPSPVALARWLVERYDSGSADRWSTATTRNSQV
jgi:acyl-coenzyme A synthetase/AMP-(fatty) acid ligase